jgi:3-hydroxyisobutyrate dehydrogenase-like beta-hydroxyacid dehydrogenase
MENDRPAVGVVGLGIMGGAMARNLRASGRRVIGHDIDADVCAAATADGIEIAATAGELAAAAADIIISLPSASAVISVAQAIALSPARRCTIVETSTLSLADKQEIASIVEVKGHVALDCPLSGTGAQAKDKDLVILASGDASEIARLVPLFLGFGRRHFDLGAYGNGTRMKLVANHLVAIHNVASAEAMVLGMKAGLDPRQIVEVIRAGAANSRIFELRAPLMAERRYEPATMRCSTWAKDMAVIGAFASALKCPTPLFDATEAIYDAGLAEGHHDLDTASVCAVLEVMAELER